MDTISKAKKFIKQCLTEDLEQIGTYHESVIAKIVNAWMNDTSNSEHRFETIKKYYPKAKNILDMASGAGTFVYYGLMNGYNAYGIEPEEWKHKFNELKAKENNYPVKWQDNFIKGFGENLPFNDHFFDLISTYQTLEHVNNTKKCLSEMLRVTKSGGGIHICCPDYRGTFEGHYNVPWLPRFPKIFARFYLKAIGKNPRFLDTLNYTTTSSIKKNLKRISAKKQYEIRIIDLNKVAYKEININKNNLGLRYKLYKIRSYLRKLFKSEIQTNLLVDIITKEK